MTQDKLKTKDDTKMYLGAVYQVSYRADRSRCYRHTACQTFYWNSSTKPKKKNEQYIFIKISLPSVSFLPFSVSRGKKITVSSSCSLRKFLFTVCSFRNDFTVALHSIFDLFHDYKLVLTSISVDSCKRQSY